MSDGKSQSTNLKLVGFLNRQSYKIRYTDIIEILYAQIILTKISDPKSEVPVQIIFGMTDLFAGMDNYKHRNEKVVNKERIYEYMEDALNYLLGSDCMQTQEEEWDIVEFYNHRILRCLNYLSTGDGEDLIKCLDKVEVITNGNDFSEYIITLTPCFFIANHAVNINNMILLNDKAYLMFRETGADMSVNVSYKKQLDLLREALDTRANLTGETAFDFNSKEGIFRHIINYTENGAERLTLPSPLSLSNGQRLSLPLLLEMNGIIDINAIKIVSSPDNINDIEIVFSINKPAIQNKYLSDVYGLSAQQRMQMTSTEIRLYEEIHRKLSLEYGFNGRKDIEKNFALFMGWMIRKLSYCLEEPSFIKDKAQSWLLHNGEKKYVQMEDEFFLPFLYEKLIDAFGSLVIKKPEKFGGEIDILFGNLPVELKVSKGSKENLIDEIVDEKYRPASQAATYAATTQLGFVVVLDLPDTQARVSNVSNCCKVITREFEHTEFKTIVVVLIFYCNLPKPSAAH